MLRSLPRRDEVSYASLLAHAVLLRGLHERIPTTTVSTYEATRSMIIVRRGKQRVETRAMENSMPPKRVMPDRSKITVTSENEVKCWIRHFGVTREELERAVERVGNSAASVRKELRNLAPGTTGSRS